MDALRFVLNGEPVELRGVRPTVTLLDWLRGRGLTGTKEGCAEGDCGACTVALRWAEDGRLVARPVCACITLLPMVHGREVVTVEALAGPEKALHPVQEAMARLHGSQCGFCTPGFVMSLWALARDAATPDMAEIDRALAGNLCRCTGYGPIRAAARKGCAAGRAPWEDDDASALARLEALQVGPLDYAAEGRRFLQPETLEAFAQAALDHPEATLLAGATDVGLWVTKDLFDPEVILSVARVRELREIRETGDTLILGAAVTWAEARDRLAEPYPEIAGLIDRVGGAQVRAAGTVGGNVGNGSPVGDLPPALIAAGATLRLRRGPERREMALEDFFLGYRRQDRRPGEFVEALIVPRPAEPGRLRCHKVSKRFDSDVTAVLGCFDLALERGRVVAARLAWGGMAATPARSRAAEAALVGRAWDETAVAAAQAALAEDFRPLDDMRASAAYRMQAARGLLTRHFVETTRPEVATRLAGRRPLPGRAA
jgi:xanthine dehydrogenase small subunit